MSLLGEECCKQTPSVCTLVWGLSHRNLTVATHCYHGYPLPSGLDVRTLSSENESGQLVVQEEEGSSISLPPELHQRADRVASVYYTNLSGRLPDALPGDKFVGLTQ